LSLVYFHCHDIAEILLKVALNSINHNHRLIFSEIYTKEGTKIIASSSSAGDPARIFETGDNPVSYGGTLWHFEYLTQIMYAKGPLDTPVVVKVHSCDKCT
jgi:hypothetical protein